MKWRERLAAAGSAALVLACFFALLFGVAYLIGWLSLPADGQSLSGVLSGTSPD